MKEILMTAVVIGGPLFFIWLGYEFAKGRSFVDQADIDTQRRMLQEQWTALENAHRVNDVLFEAQHELRRAATVRRRPGQRR